MAAFQVTTLAFVLATIVARVPNTEATDQVKHLRRLSRNHTNHIVHQGNGAFVDGTETIYDDFSLAWRFLGFYTDCNICVDGGDDNGGDEEFREVTECIQDGQDTVCRKHALWAAYVDEGYTGNGKNEYQYYDRQHKRWDDSLCQNSNDDDSRCVKMDCHDPFSKNFKLVGVYKDSNIDEFLENMIDYSGDCVWNDEEYKFMQAMNSEQNNNYVDYWPPKKCTAIQNQNNGKVKGYYDAKPSAGGRLEMTLYSDNTCTTPHEDKNNGNLQAMIGRSMSDVESWNSAMDAFKICQPCVSYDTFFLGKNNNNKKDGYNTNGDRYTSQNQGDDDGNANDNFVCKTNLQQDEPTNQCKVLLEGGQDTMSVATYRDILLAESQGSVTGIDLSPANQKGRGKLAMGEPFVKPNHKWLSILLLLLSIAYFVAALSTLFVKDRSRGSKNKKMNEPLVGGSNDKKNRRRSKSPKSSKTIVSTAAVANPSRKTKKQKAVEKEQKKAQKKGEQKQQKKKSILKKSKYNDEDDGGSQESSTHYSKFQL